MIHVALVADGRYLQNLAVALHSLSFRSNAKLTVHLFLDVLSEPLTEHLMSCVDLSKVDLCCYPLDYSLLLDLQGMLPAHVSKTALYRIFLPQLLPKLQRIIYLDCDVLVRTDLESLWSMALSETGAAAVIDATVPRIGDDKGVVRHSEFGINPNLAYCNTGVMLIDLDYWRRYDVTVKAVSYITTDRERSSFIDQAAINAALLAKWTILDHSWNVQTIDYYRNRIDLCHLQEATFDPKIVHFTGPRSPGRVISRHPYSTLWQIYLSKTPFVKRSSIPVSLRIKLTELFYQVARALKLAKPVASYRF